MDVINNTMRDGAKKIKLKLSCVLCDCVIVNFT